jgi:hypothetical protein
VVVGLGLLVVGLAGSAHGQGLRFEIAGAVRDLTGAPVAGVAVGLSGDATASATTDAAGRYAFAGLAGGGTYTVTPTAAGWSFAPAAHTLPSLARDHGDLDFVVTAGRFTRYFAEGATGDVFSTAFALLNPTDTPAETTLTFQTPEGTNVPVPLTVAPHARATVHPATVPGLEATALATVIASTQPLVADRTMRWDARGYGSHTETSVAAPQTQWYLAEGATHSGFQLFYLIQNPQPTAATVTVTYLRPAPQPPLVKAYPVGARSRTNLWVNLETFETPSGPQPLLAAAEVSAAIQSDVPIIVERAMYLSRGDRVFDAGHASAAAPALAPTWFLAEGATGPYFDLFALIANPTDTAAEVAVTYLLPASAFVKTYTVAAQSRFTIWVDQDDPRLADTAVSLVVTATTGGPILVERAMWWPGDGWTEGHNSRGATETGVRWALADGEVGGAVDAETYVLVANTSPFAAAVQVTAHFEDGTTVTRALAVPATSRFTIPMGAVFPETVDRRFGVTVESRPTGHGVARLVVERASYSDATLDGQVVRWAAGANAFGTRLQDEPAASEASPGALALLAAPAATALPAATVTADPAHATQAVVGPAGGSVTTTAADVAATDETRLAALAELYRWDSLRTLLDALLGAVEVGGVRLRGQLTTRATEGRAFAAAILGHGYAAWNEPCRTTPGALRDRLRLADRAAQYAVLALFYLEWLQALQADLTEVDQAAPPNLALWGLGYDQIPASFCVLETLTVHEPALAPGATGQLRVTAGPRFASDPPLYGDVMDVAFQPDPPSYAGLQRAVTSAAGEAVFPITADGSGQRHYRVCATVASPVEAASLVTLVYRPDGVNCRSAVTGVVVAPAQTTIAPGASRQFTVLVEGTTNQAVTWSVDGGGTVSSTGRFTSDGTEGTFYVRATSVEDPTAVGLAEITVRDAPPPAYPCVDQACSFAGTFTWCEPNQYGVVVCHSFASGTAFSHPSVRIEQLPSEVRGWLQWTCMSAPSYANKATALIHPRPDGSFTGSGPGAACLGPQSVTGTVTAQHLVFTWETSLGRGITISFTGTRAP